MSVVLVVDDDVQVRDLWADALSEAGFEVFVAPSGVQGVAIARTRPVDVIVTDILMPYKDGIETLLEVKALRPAVKVLVVSGGGQVLKTPFLDIAERLGADATLRKPVDMEEFCRTVRDLACAARKGRESAAGA